MQNGVPDGPHFTLIPQTTISVFAATLVRRAVFAAAAGARVVAGAAVVAVITVGPGLMRTERRRTGIEADGQTDRDQG